MDLAKLLHDCRLIALWDSVSSPATIPLVRVSASTLRMDRPEWMNDQARRIHAGMHLRGRLNELWRGTGKTQLAARVIEWLTPRARVLSEDGRNLASCPLVVGNAFASDQQRARWDKDELARGWRHDKHPGRRAHGQLLIDTACDVWARVELDNTQGPS